MKVRNILSGALALAVSVSAATVIASAEKPADGVLFLGFADGDWKAQIWGSDSDPIDNSYLETATLNGNGTYTVAVDLSSGYTVDGWVDEDTGDLLELTTGNSIAAMGVHVMGTYPATMGADILSVKVDGTEIPVSGVSFADTESGGRRMHIYNEWANYDAASDDHATSDPAAATGTIIDKGDIGEWSRIEVTFEVYGLEDAAPAADDAAETEAAPAETQAAPAETQAPAAGDVAAATDSSKGSPETGIADVAAIAGLAIVAGGAVLVAKKRK